MKWNLLLLILFAAGGCGALQPWQNYRQCDVYPRPYEGTIMQIRELFHPGSTDAALPRLLLIPDLPLTAACETYLLIGTLPNTIGEYFNESRKRREQERLAEPDCVVEPDFPKPNTNPKRNRDPLTE